MTDNFRLFTLDEARKALPLVQRIAEDTRQIVLDLTRITGGIGVLMGTQEKTDVPEESRAELEAILARFESCVAELNEIGVELKGIDPVLIDFRSLRGGNEIYLCWALGEKDIAHWHPLSGGYAGRKEL